MQHKAIKWFEWITHTILLQDWLELRTITEEFLKEKNNNILYVVDTDIVTSYTAPYLMGNAQGNNEIKPYGVIFPPDSKNYEAAGAITEIISKYIFYNLLPNIPMFQLEEHERETKRVYQAVLRKANIQLKNIRNLNELSKQLKNIKETTLLNEYRKQEKENISEKQKNAEKSLEISKLIENIIKNLKKVYFSLKDNPNTELERYLKLIERGALVDFAGIQKLAKESDFYNFLFKILDFKNLETKEYSAYYHIYKKWYERFEKEYKIYKSTEDDIKALARLEVINKKVEPKVRVILITGADKIHHVVKKNDQEFYNKYIRHFHSFSMEAFSNIEQEIQNNEQSIKDFLGVNFLKKYKTIDSSMVFELENNWKNYRDTLINYSIGKKKNRISKIINKVEILENEIKNKKLEDIKKEIDTIIKEIGEETIRTRLEFVSEMVKIGIKYLQEGRQVNFRNPPLIYFSSYPKTKEIFLSLIKNRNFSNFDDEIEKIKDECKGADGKNIELGINDYGYMYFLIAGAIYASLNEWEKTVNLCEHAILIANHKPLTIIEDKVISGREAYFLLASALRLTIQHEKDFKEAKKVLQKAKEALEYDISKNPKLENNKNRIKAEELAIKVGELHFYNYKNKQLNISDEDLNKLNQMLELNCCDDEIANEILKNQNAINTLQIISLYLQVNSDTDINDFVSKYKNTIEEALETEKIFKEKNSYLRKTFLMESYYLFAKILLNKNISMKIIEEHFKNIPTQLTSIYDNDRYNKLKSQCMGILEK